jgi:hypothetical protein
MHQIQFYLLRSVFPGGRRQCNVFLGGRRQNNATAITVQITRSWPSSWTFHRPKSKHMIYKSEPNQTATGQEWKSRSLPVNHTQRYQNQTLYFPRSVPNVRIWHTQSTPLVTSLSAAAVTEALSRMKPTSAGNSKSVSTLFKLANPEGGSGFVSEIQCCVLYNAILLKLSALLREFVTQLWFGIKTACAKGNRIMRRKDTG